MQNFVISLPMKNGYAGDSEFLCLEIASFAIPVVDNDGFSLYLCIPKCLV